jgi:hypothetical protein
MRDRIPIARELAHLRLFFVEAVSVLLAAQLEARAAAMLLPFVAREIPTGLN